MIITVKNLQQQTFTVEFDAEKTVLQLKEKIYVERGSEYVVEKQKLIYAGVILDDDRTIASYNVHEKKFIVVLLKRDLCGAQKSDQSGASTSDFITSVSSTETGTSVSNIGSEEKHKITMDRNTKKADTTDDDAKSTERGNRGGEAVLVPATSRTSIQSTISDSSLFSVGSATSDGSISQNTYSSGDLAGVFSDTSFQSRAESNLLMGEEYNRSVESIIEMGYSRELVVRAMTASFNNPERAVEYLISGIPESNEGLNNPVDTEERAVTESNTSAEHFAAEGTVAGLSSGSMVIPFEPNQMLEIPAGADPFEFLRNQPQFLQMRSLVYQNPDLLHAVLQQIGQTNPALLQLISENQDAFLNMLNEPIEGQPSTGQQHPRRRTPGRRAQLAAAARAASGGEGLHVRPLDTAPGSGGDGPLTSQRAGESGDAGSDNIRHNLLPHRPDRATEMRAATSDTVMRDRAAAAAAVAALTAAATVAVDRNASGNGSGDGPAGDGMGIRPPTSPRDLPPTALSTDVEGDGTATIRLNPADQEAIERLKALGFPEFLVLQAYFACDKDEQLAANFLISSVYDD